MKKMKKLTSLLLVLVLSLALAIPCFAAEPAAADDGAGGTDHMGIFSEIPNL